MGCEFDHGGFAVVWPSLAAKALTIYKQSRISFLKWFYLYVGILNYRISAERKRYRPLTRGIDLEGKKSIISRSFLDELI